MPCVRRVQKSQIENNYYERTIRKENNEVRSTLYRHYIWF